MRAFADEHPLLEGMYWVKDAGACSGVYVLEEGRTLIDAGNMYGLLDELQDLGPLERVERILLTHSHFDHVGGLEEIYQTVSPDLYIHPLARDPLRLHRQPFPAFFDALEKDGKMKFIQEGDVIEGAPSLRVIHTPGHTAGDVCYFDDSSMALFCGDAILPHTHPLGAVLSKPDEPYGGRMEDKVESLRKLLKFPVRHLFCGHGEPIFHKGGDQIKISLITLYKALHEEHPERAWLAMGHDLLEAGLHEDARQCAAKASQLVSESSEARDLYERTFHEHVQ